MKKISRKTKYVKLLTTIVLFLAGLATIIGVIYQFIEKKSTKIIDVENEKNEGTISIDSSEIIDSEINTGIYISNGDKKNAK